jgi:DNA processing protein
VRADTRSLGEIWHSALDDVTRRVDETIARDPWFEAMQVCVLGDPDYPRVLAHDPDAPAVLFALGNLAALNQQRVGIIGTRHATAHGRACARCFGDALAGHGVAVVSGLARGIDVSAHRGVIDHLRHEQASPENASAQSLGLPIGVVASGLDVVYPPEHRDVWDDVAHLGVLIAESPPGTEPHAYRFPLRNRIIAALCDVLVVVESRATGGSMITVREALQRGVTVLAVPGSTSTRAAEGTNLLIRDGASIAVEPDDVLAVLGIEQCRHRASFDPRVTPVAGDADILDVMGNEPCTLDTIVERSRRDLPDVAVALGRLEAQGWLMCTAGWFERLSEPAR